MQHYRMHINHVPARSQPIVDIDTHWGHRALQIADVIYYDILSAIFICQLKRYHPDSLCKI